jgi:hypothetical protein
MNSRNSDISNQPHRLKIFFGLTGSIVPAFPGLALLERVKRIFCGG